MPPVPPSSIADSDWASSKRWTCAGSSPLNLPRKKWLPEWAVCPLTAHKGKYKKRTALGESCIKRFSDRGSTPLGSTKITKRRAKVRLLLFCGAFKNGSRTQLTKQPSELFCERWPKNFARCFKKLNPKHRAKFKNDSPRVHQNNKKGVRRGAFHKAGLTYRKNKRSTDNFVRTPFHTPCLQGIVC